MNYIYHNVWNRTTTTLAILIFLGIVLVGLVETIPVHTGSRNPVMYRVMISTQIAMTGDDVMFVGELNDEMNRVTSVSPYFRGVPQEGDKVYASVLYSKSNTGHKSIEEIILEYLITEEDIIHAE
jgi:hypothetical protein